jgi:DNA-directed RNA polymerase subunit beta'
MGKIDRLTGFKENVIMGHLIPAGTGFQTHRSVDIELTVEEPEPIIEEPEPDIGEGDGIVESEADADAEKEVVSEERQETA